ncbi:hypothetical protein C8J56DRAFT_897425 [Mycena floridula]|nr:hypothetical protein C8J56DRAFT_897425 [Mycena floridula]
MPSKAARTKAKAAKLAQRAAQQNVGPADNPANIAGSSNGPPTSTSFPGLGNTTGSTMATVGSQNSLAIARDEIPSSAQGQVSSVLSSVPSGFTIHSNHGESALPIIPEDERARSDIIGCQNRPTAGIVINDGPRSHRTSTATSFSSRSSRSSNRSSSGEDEMSEHARRLRRADKQRHHRARIPKGLDDVETQEAIFQDARRRSVEENNRPSTRSPTSLFNNAMNSMSSLIRSELHGIINAAIEQLRAPRGADETDDEYQLRQDSLRHLENPGAYATRNISTIVRPAETSSDNPVVDAEPQTVPPETENASVFVGPPSWQSIGAPTMIAPPSYSINPGVTETAIVMPVAVPNGSASRPNRYERTVRMRRLYQEAGAGHVEIGRNEFHSESTDIESAEEVARIRQLVEMRGPGSNDNIPELFDVDSDSTMPINVRNRDLLGRDLLSPDGSITTTSSAHVRRLARITERVNARARLNMEEERALRRAQAEERDRRASQIRGPRPEAPAQITVEMDPVPPAAPDAAEAIPVAVPVVLAQTVDAIAAVVEPIIVAERIPDFPGRVALQRTRLNQLRESGEATVPDQAFGLNGRQNVADQGNVPRNAAMARDARLPNPPDSDGGSSYPHTDSGFTDTDESSSHSGLPQGDYPEDRRCQARRRHRANQADRNHRENERSAHSGGGGDGDDEPTDSGGGSDDSEDTERPESRNGDAPDEEGR